MQWKSGKMPRINPGTRAGTHLHAEGEVNENKKMYSALSTRLLEMSESEDYEEAKHEWRVTGNVWYIPDAYYEATLPIEHIGRHNGYCVCGHPIHWNFEIENTKTVVREIVGSECIENWMIIRHLKEIKGLLDDEITEEKIKEWMKEAVRSMKCDWWWKENGDDFEEMFNAIKEIDARFSVRLNRRIWKSDTQRYENTYKIAKTAAGSLSGFASVVWRWNNPVNPKRQIETRGYPNKKLWREIQLLFARLKRYENQLNDENVERIERINSVVNMRERQNILAEKRQRERNKQRELAMKLREESVTEKELTNFKDMCEYYDIPVFSLNDGNTRWEEDFLFSIKKRLCEDKDLSKKQIKRLLSILNSNEKWKTAPTERQLKYITSLGGDADSVDNKTQASKYISKLKGEE